MLFGLTGNMGCGKSSVARIISAYPDVSVFDCDVIARQILSDKAHSETIHSILGESVFTDEEIDFNSVVRVILNDTKRKRSLEAWAHPLVWEVIRKAVGNSKERQINIVESAIIYEIEWECKFAGIIVATCSHAEQKRRLRDNRMMNDAQIDVWLSHQFSQDEKARRSQFVIRTDIVRERLEAEIHTLYLKLREYAGEQI